MAFKQQDLARKLLAEGRHCEAERAAKLTVGVLASAGLAAPLADALVTHGTTLARLQRTEDAQKAFDRAIKVAEHAAENECGAAAALTAAEELLGALPLIELRYYYWRAEQLLTDGGCDAAMRSRLRTLAIRLQDLEQKCWQSDPDQVNHVVSGEESGCTTSSEEFEPTFDEVERTIGYLERLYGGKSDDEFTFI